MTIVAPAPLAELLAEAATAGLHLRVASNDRLVIAGQPPPELLARLLARKAELVALLRSTPGSAGAAT